MNKVPNEFLCPISMELMEDPVLCEDGQTYERRHIMEWLQRSPTSPITRQPMGRTVMVSNYALKASIQRWKEEKKRPPIPSAPPSYTPSPSYNAPHPPTYAIPYTPPSVYPSYQQQPQTATTNLSIVPIPQQQTQTASESQRGKKILALACLILLFLVILSAILSSSPPSSRNNDDDN